MTTLIREAVARAHDFLLEPSPAEPAQRRGARPTEVAVLGLSAGSGVTTLARGLALMLEVPDKRPARVLSLGEGSGHEVVQLAGGASALVWDVASSAATAARSVAPRADAVVLVAGKRSEPALAEVTADMLREDFGRVVLVANRVTDPSRWNGRPDLCVPESWLGAALLGRGRRPPGALGAAFARLAAIVQGWQTES
jgi:hypothetical protein